MTDPIVYGSQADPPLKRHFARRTQCSAMLQHP
jgi:hypothetical protein